MPKQPPILFVERLSFVFLRGLLMILNVTLYVFSVLGAAALVLMMPRRDVKLRLGGAVIGAGALGLLWLVTSNVAGWVPNDPTLFEDAGDMDPLIFGWYFIFSLIAIVSAVKVITHSKPVFAALWFVMVILATAGLFLMLGAVFMALALILIYAGAILVTYMFVIMLAQQSQSDTGEDTTQDYDVKTHEPVLACAAGFLLLAVLLQIGFIPMQPVPEARAMSDKEMITNVLANRPSEYAVERLDDANIDDHELVLREREKAEQLSNGERVGVDLFVSHPLGLELAGLILLVSLIGAVVIAKKHVYEEDEVIDRHPGASKGPRKD